jgi:hypothetical protein
MLLVHGVLLALLTLDVEPRPRARQSPQMPEGVWIRLSLPPPPPDPQYPEPTSAPPANIRQLRAAPITVPAVVTTPSTEPAPATPPRIDWYGAASRIASDSAAQDAPAEAFSAPPQTMRKPCKEPRSSFRWKKDQKSTGSAGLTLGWEPPDPDKHYFDDMQTRKDRRSSVPDAVVCD